MLFSFICLDGLWKISCTTCREDSSKAFEESWENITKLIWVFYGNSGKSEPISLTTKTGIQADDKLIFDVKSICKIFV